VPLPSICVAILQEPIPSVGQPGPGLYTGPVPMWVGSAMQHFNFEELGGPNIKFSNKLGMDLSGGVIRMHPLCLEIGL